MNQPRQILSNEKFSPSGEKIVVRPGLRSGHDPIIKCKRSDAYCHIDGPELVIISAMASQVNVCRLAMAKIDDSWCWTGSEGSTRPSTRTTWESSRNGRSNRRSGGIPSSLRPGTILRCPAPSPPRFIYCTLPKRTQHASTVVSRHFCGSSLASTFGLSQRLRNLPHGTHESPCTTLVSHKIITLASSF